MSRWFFMACSPKFHKKIKCIKIFFFGKNDSLFQSIFDGALRAIFSGVVVAAASVYIVNNVESSIERSERYSALKNYKNSVISEALEFAGESFENLGCVRKVYHMDDSRCKNELRKLIVELKFRSELIKALKPEANLSSVESVISSARVIINTAGGKDEADSREKENLKQQFSENFVSMINEIATNFE